MTDKPKLLIKDYVYVPYHLANKKAIKKHLHIHHFNDKVCKSCEYRDDRPCDVCQECPAYAGLFRFYRKEIIGGNPYIGIAKGRPDIVKAVIGSPKNYRIYDRRVHAPMNHDLKFNYKKHGKDERAPMQLEAVEAMLKVKNGYLKSAPRSGKTLMATMMSCRIGQTTLVLAHQDDLLKQFYATIVGKTDEYGVWHDGFTNARKLEELTDEQVVVLAKKPADYFSGASIILSTYQMFLRPNGQKLLRKLAKRIGFVITDEGHKGSAHGYSRILASLYPSRMYMLSATIERKDGKHFVVDRLIGPVIHQTVTKELKPTVHVRQSKLTAKVSAKRWDVILKGLYRHKGRTKDIVTQTIKLLDMGHNVVIPLAQRKAIDDLTNEINKAWLDHTGTTQIIAEQYYRYNGNGKEEVLNRARSGERRVTVAMQQMLTGVDVPKWSAILYCSPMNNQPNFEQVYKRVCTPLKGKKDPIIIFFADVRCKPAMSCFMASISHARKLGWTFPKKTKLNIEKVTDAAAALGNSGGGYSQEPNMPMTIGIPGKRISL